MESGMKAGGLLLLLRSMNPDASGADVIWHEICGHERPNEDRLNALDAPIDWCAARANKQTKAMERAIEIAKRLNACKSLFLIEFEIELHMQHQIIYWQMSSALIRVMVRLDALDKQNAIYFAMNLF